MPSTYACAVVEMKVMALAWVAMIESPMAYQGMVLFAEHEFLGAAGTAAAPQAVGNQEHQPGEHHHPVEGLHIGDDGAKLS